MNTFQPLPIILALLLSFLVAAPAGAQPPPERTALLAKGVNLSHWLWLPHARTPEARREYFTAADAKLIRALGMTHVRLPFEPSSIWDPGTDELKPAGLDELLAAINICLAGDLAVVVDAHPTQSPWIAPDEAGRYAEFERFWSVLAARLAPLDPGRVFIEILNEPHDQKDPTLWPAAQVHLAAAIRAVAPGHTIIATGDEWGGIKGLKRLTKPLSDPNIIYSFHFYDPHTFTHQGATWGWPGWKHIKGLPYPSTPESVAPIAETIKDPQGAGATRNYGRERWDAAKIAARVAEAAAWSRQHGVPVYCGEFGVFREHSIPEARCAWLRDATAALNDAGIGWAMWDYSGGFALTQGPPGSRAPDPATAGAIGLTR